MKLDREDSTTEALPPSDHSRLIEREALFQLSRDLMLICSLDGRLLGVNPAAERTLGWDHENHSGTEWLNLIHPKGLELQDCLRHQSGAAQWESETLDAEGETRWIHWSCTIDPDHDRAVFVGRDLTDQQQLVKKLSHRESDLSSLMAGARCALWQADVFDVGGVLEWILEFRDPEAAREFLGFEVPEGVPYDYAYDLAKVEEDIPHMRVATADELHAGLRHYQQEFRIRTESGEIRWISEDVMVEPVAEGRWRLIGVCTDVTEQRRSREAVSRVLKTARCLLWQGYAYQTGEGFYWETEIQNPDAATELVPLDLSNYPNYSFAFHFAKHEEDLPVMEARANNALLTGQSGYSQEFRIRTSTGEIKWLYDDVVIEKISPGKFRLTGVCTDITDRKRAQEETVRVLHTARCLLWEADVAEWEGGLNWQTEIQNPDAAQEYLPLEVSEGECYEDAFYAAKHEDDIAEMDSRSTNAILRGETGYQQEFRVRIATGEIRWLSEDVVIEPLAGRRWRVTGVCTDITDRKRAQEETVRALRSARCLLWEAQVEMVDGRLHWETEIRNPDAAQEFLPLDLSTEGGNYSGAFHYARFDEDRPKLHQHSREAILSGADGYRQEYRVRTATGEVRWLGEDVSINPQGLDRWIVTGVCTDITDLKKAQDETNQVLAKARCVLWQADVVEVDGDLHWDLTFRNTESLYTFLPIEIPEGWTFTEAFGGARLKEDAPLLHSRSKSAILSGAPGYQQEFAIRTLEGLRWLAEDVTIEKTGVGRWRLTGVCTDISARKQAEEMMVQAQADLEARVQDRTSDLRAANQALLEEIAERKKAQEELRASQEEMLLAKEEAERANQAKSEFLSRMSHELRTPLNAILGFGQILERQSMAPAQKESVEYVLRGGRHLLSLINEILDLSKVETGHMEVTIEPVSVSETVRETCKLLRTLAEEQGISLLIDESSLDGRWVSADEQRFKQVLLNLLSNAIKYNRPGGRVEVNCTERSGHWAILVRDTGIGIPAEDVSKLFVPFERLGAANSLVEGTGLGLALSQRLVSLMGGRITVESVPTAGSTFGIELEAAQLRQPETDSTVGEEDSELGPTGRSFSLLCIEDNLSNLRLIEMILLARPELSLQSVMQGSVGLDLARRLQPDLILLDLNLPDMSGLDVLRQLQSSERTQNIPVLVITADATVKQMENVIEAGAVAYLTKPLDVTEFLSTVERVLRH